MKKIIALGFFDGVHLGHQALLRECTALAQQLGLAPAAITFEIHPQAFFTNNPPAQINTVADRDRLLRRYGAEEIYSLPVNEKGMSTKWEPFLEDFLAQGAVGFVCGSDFRFGHKGEGDAAKLQAFCREKDLPCTVVPEQLLEGRGISSTHIRYLLGQGEMAQAVKFLGHPHLLSGEVISGRRLGRTLGIPTANLALPEDLIVPKFGVYACFACFEGEKHPGVANIGNRPTVGGHRTTVEPWILDFDGDLYGKEITLEFYDFIRPEQKFSSLEELKAQIHQDADTAREILSRGGNLPPTGD